MKRAVLSVYCICILRAVWCKCQLDKWGQPLPNQNPDSIFTVPAIMPIHISEKGKEPDKGSVQGAEAVLYTVAYINRHVLNTTGFCLQTQIVDNYMLARFTVSLAMKQVGRLTELKTPSCLAGNGDNGFSSKPPVVGILGPATSDNAIALANLCNVLQIPQISYAATSLDLDDRKAYPFFLRTVPSDQIQARAILQIISKSKSWSYIGIIASDDIYGGAGLSAFLTQAIEIKREFCIAFQYKLEDPNFVANQVLEHIKETELSVIVLFSGVTGTEEFFKALNSSLAQIPDNTELKEKVLNVVYIGSDSWSTLPNIFEDYHGIIFKKFIGVSIYAREIKGFREYLRTLNETNYNSIYNSLETNYFLQSYKTWTGDILTAKLDDHSSTTADAAHAFGQGILEYIKKYSLNSSSKTNTSLLFEVLQQINFTSISGNEVFFGSRDQQAGRYYIFEYVDKKFVKTGNYSHQTLSYDNPYKDHPSICSAPCQAGQWKKSTSPCCHECVKCAAHHHSDGSRSECLSCNETYTHNSNHTACIPVTSDHISFSSTFAFILYLLVVLGVVAVGGIVTIFLLKFHTPVVQGHGVFIYITLLATCFLLMGSTLLFVGAPSDMRCNLQLGITFVGVSTLFLCTICLSETVILKMRAVENIQFYILQVTILFVGITTQVILISLVIHFQPQQYQRTEVKRGLVYGECTPQPPIIAWLSFFAISITSLILSFRGRNINENFNEGKFLAFQTIAMHIVIVAFIPTKLLLKGPILSGAWTVFVLIMCYIVLIVLFIPKLYIIIYRQYKNEFVGDELTDLNQTNGIINEEESSEVSYNE